MTLKEIRKWQQSAMRSAREAEQHKDLVGLQVRATLANDVALWEIAAQLVIANNRRKPRMRK